MATPESRLDRHYRSAKEHLAGVKAAQVWVQELMAQHLLDSQHPIRDRPPAGKDPRP